MKQYMINTRASYDSLSHKQLFLRNTFSSISAWLDLTHTSDTISQKMSFFSCHQQWLARDAAGQSDRLLEQFIDKIVLTDRHPRIWACFHIGPYGLLVRTLLQYGLGVVILLNAKVYKKYASRYLQKFEDTFGRLPTANEILFVQSKSRSDLLRLRRCLAAGMHAICFLDGRDGEESDREGYIPVRVANQTLMMRGGIAALARMTQVPLQPLLCWMEEDNLKITRGAEIHVVEKAQELTAIQQCFDLIDQHARQTWPQWELLPEVPHWIKPERHQEVIPVTPAVKLYPRYIQGQGYAINYATQHAYPIDLKHLDLLWKVQVDPVFSNDLRS